MEKEKDRYFIRNAAGVALVEVFWGLGFPVVMESTFLPLFLKNLGASDFLIGLVPSFLMTGIAVFPLFSSYLTRNCDRKKPIVIGLHMVSSLSILAFGLFLLQVRNPKVILPVFFACYLVFSLCIGLTLPVWLNFLVKIFSSRKNVQGLSIMYASQNVSKIASSLIILGLVESYAFSLTAAAWIFLSAGALFLVGSLCFLLTRELPVTLPEKGERNGFFLHVTKTFQEMTANKPLIRYLIGDLDYIITLTVIAFYANYATQYFGVEKYVAAGLFVCFIYTGAITANLLLGTIGFLTLKQKFLATKFFNLALLLLLIWSPGMISFLAASALLGLCRGTRSIIYSPAVKQLSRRADATAYFALAPLLTIGFGAGFPLFFGHMLDRFSALGAGAYQLMFCFCMVCVMITLGVAWFTDFDFQSAP